MKKKLIKFLLLNFSNIPLKSMAETIQKILEFQIIPHHEYGITVFHLLKITALYVIIRLLLHFIKAYLKNIIFNRNEIDEGRKSSIIQIIKYFIYIGFCLISLQVINIDISLLIAGSAALLVGLGFGLQHLFNDLISGIIILFEGHLNKGDIIEINGLIGKVDSVGLRTSRIITLDNVFIMVPNSKFIQENIINWTLENKVTRFHIQVGVAYGSDTELVSSLLKKCAKEHPSVVSSPKPKARFTNFGDSALDFELMFWSKSIWDIEDIKSELRYSIDEKFRSHNIIIPFPQRDIHIVSGNM